VTRGPKPPNGSSGRRWEAGADRSTRWSSSRRDPPIDPVLGDELFATSSTGGSRRSRDTRPDPSAGKGKPRHDRRKGHGILQPGTIVDKYRVEELVGTGGFATVYRATHLLLKVPVALKLMRQDVLRNSPNIASHLVEEARYAARINHPSVVRVFDVTQTSAVTFIVMEYIEGRTLAKAIEAEGPLEPERVVRIGLDVAAGLRAGLECDVIHRDIKPANILLPIAGGARIVDLGLAHATSTSHSNAPARGTTSAVGTRGYMAPEQLRHPDRVDFRSDIYSLGVTLYEAATGSSPFAPAAGSGLRGRAMGIETWRIPDDLARLLLWMLAPSPADRPPSYGALLHELSGISRVSGS
jgi:eukaryotic-like serine/threonine-protein kinase